MRKESHITMVNNQELQMLISCASFCQTTLSMGGGHSVSKLTYKWKEYY